MSPKILSDRRGLNTHIHGSTSHNSQKSEATERQIWSIHIQQKIIQPSKEENSVSLFSFSLTFLKAMPALKKKKKFPGLGLGVEWELQLQAYSTATEILNLSLPNTERKINVSKRYMHSNIHSNTIHKSQDMQTT